MRKPKVKIINRYQKRNKPTATVSYLTYYVLVYTFNWGDEYLTIGDDITFRINNARLFDTVIDAWVYRLFRFRLWGMSIRSYKPLRK